MVLVGLGWLKDKVEQFIQGATGEGLYCPDNECLINTTLAFPYPVDLAYGDTHGLGQLGQVPVASAILTEFKDPGLDDHGSAAILPAGDIIAIIMPFVNYHELL